MKGIKYTMCDNFWICLGRIADVVGILSMLISLKAVIIARNIKKQIDYSIDLHDLSDNKFEYISKIEASIKSLQEDECNTKSILYTISSINKSIDTRFSYLSEPLAQEIHGIQNFIEEIFKSYNGSITPAQQLELINRLSCIKELLRKEDRNYEQK